MKKALITGVTGQDGSYLAELLLKKGYIVHGMIRRSSSFNTARINHIFQDPHDQNPKLFLHYGDLSDGSALNQMLKKIKPDEIYNLGAQSHVRVSFDIPEYTTNTVALGALRVLETIRDYKDLTGKNIKYYQASSSEMFGSTPPPQNELTPFNPRSPYGCAKVFAYHITKNYREAYGIFAVNGILFNHESPRRGETFVTRKITKAASRIKLGLQDKLYLGNLDATRDWGYAPEYMEAAYLMLQQEDPSDFVIGTGVTHTVRDVVDIAFRYVGIPDWEPYIAIDPVYYRPSEVDHLQADITKARGKLGWEPKTNFKDLIQLMAEADFKELSKS